MGSYSLFLVFIIISAVYCEDEEKQTQIVETKQGQIEGSLAANELYYEFLGVRYAVPVKFRAPVEPPKYTEIYKADNRAVICPQFPCNDPLAAPSDNEDCLILNIYAPIGLNNTDLPVIVFLHGGGFGTGSGSPSFYGPQYLVSHGVIVVTVNYRLNYLGFLNLKTKDAPGNAGLKDIRSALIWVRENIENFGGDVDNVTVLGQGTGGTAALYLTLSESTKGLFHKIICESGSLFTPQSFDSDPLATASHVAKSLDLNTLDPVKLFKLYTETPIKKVEEAISKQMNPKSVFLPSVEDIFEDEDPFLTDTPFNILSNKEHRSFNPVPIIIGINTVEGLTSTLDYNTITSQLDRVKNEDYAALDQKNFIVPREEKDEFRKILKETYFQNITIDEDVIGGIINMNTDMSYVGPLSLFSELYANNTEEPVFEYIFNYIGNRNLGRLLTNTSLPATANLDELFYIFELERLLLPMDENDARIVSFMTMMWTNFAKYGTPTPEPGNGEWLPYPYHLAISLDPQYVTPLTPDRAYFWKTLYLRYGCDVPVIEDENTDENGKASEIDQTDEDETTDKAEKIEENEKTDGDRTKDEVEKEVDVQTEGDKKTKEDEKTEEDVQVEADEKTEEGEKMEEDVQTKGDKKTEEDEKTEEAENIEETEKLDEDDETNDDEK